VKLSSLTFGLVLAVAPLCAFTIPVANFSFENPALASGAFTLAVPSWVVGGSEATFRPTIPGQANAIPDGLNVLALGNAGGAGTATQDTGVSLVANTIYTLSLDVLQRADFALSNYTISLFAGATLLASTSTPVTPTAGNFLLASLVYTSPALPASGTLSIQLAASGNASSTAFVAGQADFDNVSLTGVTPNGGTPEPSALVLGGLGLLPMFFLRRRRS